MLTLPLPFPDFGAPAGCDVIRSGTVTVALAEDGRALLWVHTRARGGAWLELRPGDRAWLAAVLAVRAGTAG